MWTFFLVWTLFLALIMAVLIYPFIRTTPVSQNTLPDNTRIKSLDQEVKTLHNTIEILRLELEKEDRVSMKAIVDKSLLKAVAGYNERLQRLLEA